MLAFALVVPLGVACRLEPNPLNRGTHRQLGLPPCTMVAVTGHRCPVCGMTTAWALLVRGRWMGAFRANVGGALLGLLALGAVPWLWVSAARGRWVGWAPDANVLAGALAAILALTLIDWGARLMFG